jgi:hypothetical protein
MWTNPKFGEAMKVDSGGDPKKIQDKINKAQADLKATINQLSSTNNEDKQKTLKIAISNLEKEIEKHNSELQNASGAKNNTGIENLTIPHKMPDTINGPKFDDEFTGSNGGVPYQGNQSNPGHGFQRPLNSDIPNIMSGINSRSGMSGNNVPGNSFNQNPNLGYDRNQDRYPQDNNDRNNTNPNQNGYYGKQPYRPN